MEGGAMSRNWTQEELRAASRAMKAAGHMSYEEFCVEMERQMKLSNAEEPQTAPSASSVAQQRPEEDKAI